MKLAAGSCAAGKCSRKKSGGGIGSANRLSGACVAGETVAEGCGVSVGVSRAGVTDKVVEAAGSGASCSSAT